MLFNYTFKNLNFQNFHKLKKSHGIECNFEWLLLLETGFCYVGLVVLEHTDKNTPGLCVLTADIEDMYHENWFFSSPFCIKIVYAYI